MKKSDDEEYMRLMAKYKESRILKGPESVKYLKAAQKLQEDGDVSEDVVLGCAYM
jgi:hypothetical protein